MRNLTIQRRKSYVACLIKLNVCIEDPAGDITVDGIRCRKLGKLGNGETKNFLIGDHAQRVVIYADQMSKDWCYDAYPIPQGNQDLFLTGANKYAPAEGHAFRFDNVPTTLEMTTRRKKAGKRGMWILIASVIVGVAAGQLISSLMNADIFVSNDPKTFQDQGMQITLTQRFQQASYDGFEVSYESNDVAVFAFWDDPTAIPGQTVDSVESYCLLFLENNAMPATDMKTHDGLTYCTYTADVDADLCHYYAFFYQDGDRIWVVQFAVFQEDLPEYESQIFQWAHSVTFPQS